MSRGRSSFKQRDLKAAVKAVIDAGARNALIELTGKDGTKVAVTLKPDEAENRSNDHDERNEWDGVQ